MNYILFDPPDIEGFYPFALTRPLGEMRIFGGTIKDFWENKLNTKVSYLTRSHLSDLYPAKWAKKNILIPASLFKNYESHYIECDSKISLDTAHKLWVSKNIENNCFSSLHQFMSLTLSRKGLQSSMFGCQSNIVLEKGFFNDDNGPIIVEEGVDIMEGVMIRGPVHICKGTTIKMGAKIYGPVIIGPHCKIGGEVSNSIFLGFSNKAHEGFLGDSIVGEWCNIGAGTSNSNLRNDYGSVKMWDYIQSKFNDSGRQFLGLYMGDHSKCAINTSFNTGTTVGVNCNVFGPGFPRNYIPSFSWGGSQGVKKYDFDKAIEVAEKIMSRRHIKITNKYVEMLRRVYDIVLKMK